jgi:hypothetical protein
MSNADFLEPSDGAMEFAAILAARRRTLSKAALRRAKREAETAGLDKAALELLV